MMTHEKINKLIQDLQSIVEGRDYEGVTEILTKHLYDSINALKSQQYEIEQLENELFDHDIRR